MERVEIIQKIKDLLRLASFSNNENEAVTAKNLAEKLKQKHHLQDKDLEEEKSFEQKENLLFSSEGIIAWKMALGSALADYFYCALIQLQITDNFGRIINEYYLHGETDDIAACQLWFEDLEKKAQVVIDLETKMRNENYKFSFAQGLANGFNQLLTDVKFKEIKKQKNKQEEKNNDGLIPVSGKEIKKPASVDNVTDSRQESGQNILNPMAYIQGIYRGRNLQLPNTLLETNA